MKIMPVSCYHSAVFCGGRNRQAERERKLQEKRAFDKDLEDNFDRYVTAYKMRQLSSAMSDLRTQQETLIRQRNLLNSEIALFDSRIQQKADEFGMLKNVYRDFVSDMSNFESDAKKGEIANRRREAEALDTYNDGFDWSSLDRLYEPYNNAY